MVRISFSSPLAVLAGTGRSMGSSNSSDSSPTSPVFRRSAGGSRESMESDDPASPVRQLSGSRESVVEEGETIHIDQKLKELLKHRLFRFEDFDFKATVGKGTFGRVRVVKIADGAITKPFALKIMQKRVVIDLKQVEHVNSERTILMTINHPFIVNLFSHFQDELRLFMLLEFVNGGELFSQLKKEGQIPDEHAVLYVGEITMALQYLHSLRIVFRDLKPENVLIDYQGHMKLTDFGFAKVVEDRTWTLCGTAEYLAPEIIQSSGYGMGVDWWALGILMFEMLTGYPPFQDDSPALVYEKVLAGAGKIDFPKHVTANSKDLILKLLVADPSKRCGCLKSGAEDIKRHKWFKGVDWDVLLNREELGPFVPSVKSPEDTTMFDRYPESTESSAPAVMPEEQAQFDGFTIDGELFPI